MHNYTTRGAFTATLSPRHSQILPQESATPHRSVLLKAQLGYGDHGKPTFPCEGKRPLTEHGFKDASTDPRRITAWRHRWPLANIGMATGERSGVFVIDIDLDPEKGIDGRLALEGVEKKHGALPATLTASTPRGGQHLYFRHVEGITNSPGGLPEGIDVRAEGGYVLVPPSAGYSWENRAEVADAPEWLVGLVKERKPTPKTERNAGSIAVGETIPEGRRNTTLTSICGRLHDGDRSEEKLTGLLLAINEARCDPPLPHAEVVAIARWTHRKAPCRTRRSPEVERRVRKIEHAFWEMWGEDFRGIGGQSDRDLLRVCLECAEQWGRLNDAGEIEFDGSEQYMALEAKISRPTVRAAAERLREKIGLRRDTRSREMPTHSGKWIIPSPAQFLPTRTNASPSPEERAVGVVVKTCAPRVVGRETPKFRHFGPVGKGKGGILLALEAFGPMDAEGLADTLGIARVRDLRRRYLDPLVEEGRVECHDEVYSLPADHAERCEEAKTRRYGSVRRRRVRSYSPDEGRHVTVVVEVGSERSEKERDEASRRAYADQRELFLRRLAQSGPEADRGCRVLLNEMDRDREAAGDIRDISHLRDVTDESTANPETSMESPTRMPHDKPQMVDNGFIHPPECLCEWCSYEPPRYARAR